jgi:peptidyl-tRNA hydrolase, PTH1 family
MKRVLNKIAHSVSFALNKAKDRNPLNLIQIMRRRRRNHSDTNANTNTNNKNYAIIGLGNPGKRFDGTRHNCGFAVIDCFVKEQGNTNRLVSNKQLESEVSGLFTLRRMEEDFNVNVVLAKPMTFMNLSGTAVKKIMKKYRVPIENVVVVYDDLDTKVGQIKIKKSGSHGGHNGVRDILDIPRVKNVFPRVRVGIGRPENEHVAIHEHVLSKFTNSERVDIDRAITKASDAVREILQLGVDLAISRQNGNVPKNNNKDGQAKKDTKIKGGHPVAVEMSVSEETGEVKVDVFARSSRKKDVS